MVFGDKYSNKETTKKLKTRLSSWYDEKSEKYRDFGRGSKYSKYAKYLDPTKFPTLPKDPKLNKVDEKEWKPSVNFELVERKIEIYGNSLFERTSDRQFLVVALQHKECTCVQLKSSDGNDCP